MPMPDPRVGDVWDVDFDPRIGNDQGGIRPALVVSGADFNAIPHRLRIVIPITGTDKGLSNQVRIAAPEGGLTKPSVIMCEQVKSQSLVRFQRKRGTVTAQTLETVQRLVGLFIDRPPG
ncbi:MAG: type II toxin-antitoxin system PemK/MazF family toxin [Chloroflexia bacterium]|nr:type II toxin-antitoxin system PemK/MazF family toxin [Chloroflexia bacterium]